MKTKGFNPQGRPIRQYTVKKAPVERFPNEEPLTPGLREQKEDLDCIGFIHDFGTDDD
jgi:hypothetical protein